MPPDLKDRVKAAAKANNRSMNAEIVATLEEKYPAPPPVDLKSLSNELFKLMLSEPDIDNPSEETLDAVRRFILASGDFDVEAEPGPDDNNLSLRFRRKK